MLLRTCLFVSLSLLCFSSCHHSEESASSSSADELPFQTVALTNLDNFQAMDASNWRVAGGAYADRQVANDLQPMMGEGVLVSIPDEQNRANLFTTWEHGDMDLSLDFMMPKGSNSGIYLQGRYEVQLFDSWGKDSVKSSDCGGIYQRWQEAQQKGYEGHAPDFNASRAPGLWQRLDIKFTAPRFDDQGKKIANARFVEVVLNGTTVQQDVEVTGPTRAAAFDDEKPTGPLMIQGDHGPVAIQNIRYKVYASTPVKLLGLQYKLYEGAYQNPAALESAEPVKEEPTDVISHQFGKDYKEYALVFDGTLDVPTDGDYLFVLRTAGPSWLYLDGREVTNNREANYMKTAGRYQTTLEAGKYPLRLVYTKYVLPWVNGLALYCEGPQIKQHALHAPGSVSTPKEPEPIVVTVAKRPVLQRGFMHHRGTKRTHTTAVGLPANLNFAVDIQNASLILAWGGEFVDVTNMWHNRGGEQTAQPLGSALELSAKPTFARLSGASGAWPDSVSFDEPYLQTKGYSLDTLGMPVFHYQLDGTLIDDYLREGNGERGLTREILCTYTDTSEDPVYCLLAEGERIEHLPDGSYGVDDKEYYLIVDDSEVVHLRQRSNNGKEQLLAAMVPHQGKASLQYTIVW